MSPVRLVPVSNVRIRATSGLAAVAGAQTAGVSARAAGAATPGHDVSTSAAPAHHVLERRIAAAHARTLAGRNGCERRHLGRLSGPAGGAEDRGHELTAQHPAR